MMKRVAWITVIIAVLVGGVFATFRDPGRIHLFAADGSVLAETQLEGWCSGFVFWETKSRGDANKATACRAENIERFDTVINLATVLPSFCNGAIASGFGGDFTTGCMDVLTGEERWPTLDGGWTNKWTGTYPYPGNQFDLGRGTETEDRGADRPGFTREGE